MLRQFKAGEMYLCARYVVLNKLRDKVDIASPASKTISSLVHPSASPLYDQAAISPQYMFKLLKKTDSEADHR